MRRGEMAKTREVPFIPYYGSVDSTPLALILLQEYIRWTMDMKSLKEFWPQALRRWAGSKSGRIKREWFSELHQEISNGTDESRLERFERLGHV